MAAQQNPTPFGILRIRDAGRLKSPLEGRRLIAEGAVIVLSVLVALWADAAWAARMDRQREAEYIDALAAEMAQAYIELSDDNEGRLWQLAQIDSLQEQFAGGSAPRSKVRDWVRGFAGHLFFFPPEAVLLELTPAGGLEVLRSSELRAAIVQYGQERPRLGFLETRGLDSWESALRPYLVEHAPALLHAALENSDSSPEL